MRATPFLYFKGDCESALQFYQACGLGKIFIQYGIYIGGIKT